MEIADQTHLGELIHVLQQASDAGVNMVFLAEPDCVMTNTNDADVIRALVETLKKQPYPISQFPVRTSNSHTP